MAVDDTKSKKRKGAPESAPKPKKQKKADEATAAAPPKKTTKARKAAVEPVDSSSTTVKSARKHAEDFFSDNETPVKADSAQVKKAKKSKASATVYGDKDISDVVEASKTKEKGKKGKKDKESAADTQAEIEAPKPKAKKGKKATETDSADATVPEEVPVVAEVKTKKGKKGKQLEVVAEPVAVVETIVAEEAPVAVETKKPKKGKKAKKQEEAPADEVVQAIVETVDVDEDEDDINDQTAALLAGFESDRDESDLEKEDEDFNEDALPQLSKQNRKALANARQDAESGVIFLGRIPHGFFEPQMKKYFAQFGKVTRLRLSRNKKTGASKHFAFIEFANNEVANIVAKTMHNYLMFGHILQCRTVAPEQVHAELFKGANKRFKVDPRNQKEGAAMARGADRAVWQKRVKNENQRRVSKAKALKDEFGYEFSTPTAKSVPAVEDEAEQQLLSEAPAAEITSGVQVTEVKPGQIIVTETVTVKKAKKGGKSAKSKNLPTSEEVAVVVDAANEQPIEATEGKKSKKRKSDVVAEKAEEPAASENVVSPSTNKAKSTGQAGTKPKRAKKAKA